MQSWSWSWSWTYRKGRKFTTPLIFSGVLLTGWTVFLVVMGESLPGFS